MMLWTYRCLYRFAAQGMPISAICTCMGLTYLLYSTLKKHLIVSPPRPMILPTMPCGQSKVLFESPTPGSSDSTLSICRKLPEIFSDVAPVIVTFLNSPGDWWSIWILVPVLDWRFLIVSPDLPMSLPTMSADTQDPQDWLDDLDGHALCCRFWFVTAFNTSLHLDYLALEYKIGECYMMYLCLWHNCLSIQQTGLMRLGRPTVLNIQFLNISRHQEHWHVMWMIREHDALNVCCKVGWKWLPVRTKRKLLSRFLH